MQHIDEWKPSKYVYRKGRLVATRDKKQVQVGSRLIADLTAQFYDHALSQYAKGKLLDLGCGKVPLYEAYREYVSENICVDWNNSAHKNEHLDTECDLTKALPFNNEEFDTIILSDVLEHIPQPEHLWLEMWRILAIEGMIIMNVPFYYCLHEQPYDFYRYTEFALRRFVENARFRLVQLEPIGGVPEILADILGKHIQSVRLIGRGLASLIQFATALFVHTALGKAVSAKTARGMPLGYCLIAEKCITDEATLS